MKIGLRFKGLGLRGVLAVLAVLAGVMVQAQIAELGTITKSDALVWDANTETNLAGYKIFVGKESGTEFALFATVATNRWEGDATRQLHGWRAVYLTAVATNAAGVEIESDPSVTNLVRFRAGVPVSPKNFKLYSLVQFVATNEVQAVPVPGLPK